MRKPAISVVIIAYNEESNIRRCLQNLYWADEIVVVDNGSTDSTLDICDEFKCRIINHPWEGYGAQKNFAIKQAECDWVLNLDADEVITEASAEEIRDVITSGNCEVYRIPRMNQFLGKWMAHGGWYPDHQIRLFRRGCGEFKVVPLHESFLAYNETACIGTLTNPMLHYTYPTVADFMSKADKYSTIDAARMVKDGKSLRFPVLSFISAILGKFAEVYLYKGGWKDGLHGFISAMLLSMRVFIRTLKIWEQTKNNLQIGEGKSVEKR